ncbi:MAG TPA: lipase, partial [Porphyromonadaceae bacterium]|nr:lipase [Porphyromonadaceae bacterium]
MRKNRFSLVLFIFGLLTIAAGQAQKPTSQTTIPASNPNIAYVGRVSFTNPESPCFTYPGVQ